MNTIKILTAINVCIIILAMFQIRQSYIAKEYKRLWETANAQLELKLKVKHEEHK